MGNLIRSGGFVIHSKKNAFYQAIHANGVLLDKLKSVGLDQRRLYNLHQIFVLMDKDNSGEINMAEFFNYIDLQRSRFSEKAFAVMDKDGSGEVDFIEFVLAVWNYCSFSHSSLVRFAFDLYDLDGSGEIEHTEATRCIREVWGSAWETSSTAHKILAKLDAMMEATHSGKLSIAQFQDFALRHPMLLFPAFQLQTEIQTRVLGKRFWARAAKKRGSINPKDLSWSNVQKISDMAKQSNTEFLAGMEDELDAEINAAITAATDVTKQRKRSTKPAFAFVSSKRHGSVSVAANSDENTAATTQTPVVEVQDSTRTASSSSKVKSKRRKHSKSIEEPQRRVTVDTDKDIVLEDVDK